MSDKYEGWTNRETWALSLHIANNEGDYLLWEERKEETDDQYSLAKELQEWTEEVFADVIGGEEVTQEARLFVDDIGSHWRIDYIAVAESLLAE